MAEKMTQKDLFTHIAEVMSDEPAVVELCKKYIAKLSKPRKRTENPEVVEFRNCVATWLSEHDGAYTISEIADAMDVSWQKVAAALRHLESDDVVMRVEPVGKSKPVFVLV